MTNKFIRQQVILAVILIIGIIVIGLALSVAQNADFLTRAGGNNPEIERLQKEKQQILREIGNAIQEFEQLDKQFQQIDKSKLATQEEIAQEMLKLLWQIQDLVKRLNDIDQRLQELQQQTPSPSNQTPSPSDKQPPPSPDRTPSPPDQTPSPPENFLLPVQREIPPLIKAINKLLKEGPPKPQQKFWQESLDNLQKLQQELEKCLQQPTVSAQRQCAQRLSRQLDKAMREALDAFIRLGEQHYGPKDPYVQTAKRYRQLLRSLQEILSLPPDSNPNPNPPSTPSEPSPEEQQKKAEDFKNLAEQFLNEQVWLLTTYYRKTNQYAFTWDNLDDLINTMRKTDPEDQDIITRYQVIRTILREIISCQDYQCVLQKYNQLQIAVNDLMEVIRNVGTRPWAAATTRSLQEMLDMMEVRLTGGEFPKVDSSSNLPPSVDHLSDKQAELLKNFADQLLREKYWQAYSYTQGKDGTEKFKYFPVALDELIRRWRKASNAAVYQRIADQHEAIQNILREMTQCPDSDCVLQKYQQFIDAMNEARAMISQATRYENGMSDPSYSIILNNLEGLEEAARNIPTTEVTDLPPLDEDTNKEDTSKKEDNANKPKATLFTNTESCVNCIRLHEEIKKLCGGDNLNPDQLLAKLGIKVEDNEPYNLKLPPVNLPPGTTLPILITSDRQVIIGRKNILDYIKEQLRNRRRSSDRRQPNYNPPPTPPPSTVVPPSTPSPYNRPGPYNPTNTANPYYYPANPYNPYSYPPPPFPF